jgi:hypothetical protein
MFNRAPAWWEDSYLGVLDWATLAFVFGGRLR